MNCNLIIGCILLLLPVFLEYGFSSAVIVPLCVSGVLLHIAFTDSMVTKIYNRDVCIFAFISIAECIATQGHFIERIAAFCILCVILVPLKFFCNKIMGFGDIKLICSSGLLLGTHSITAYLIGTVVAGMVFSVLLVLKQANRKSRLPVGPYLSYGIWVTYMYLRWH